MNITLIAVGRFKAEGTSFAALDAEGRGAMQRDVNSYFADFTGDVAKGRGVSVDHVRTRMGEGRMLRGTEAVKAGMVDAIGTLDAVLRGTARSRSARLDASTLSKLPVALARSLRALELLS